MSRLDAIEEGLAKLEQRLSFKETLFVFAAPHLCSLELGDSVVFEEGERGPCLSLGPGKATLTVDAAILRKPSLSFLRRNYASDGEVIGWVALLERAPATGDWRIGLKFYREVAKG